MELIALLERRQKLLKRAKILSYYPDFGPLRRELYRKHMQFFAAGAKHHPMDCCPPDCDGDYHRERAFLAANRIGKTEGVGAYECTLHLTGDYPDWWPGRRFDKPISAWAAGDSSKTVRDIIQAKLLGPEGSYGTGMIPMDRLKSTTAKGGVPNAVEGIYVRHVTGGVSKILLKSYDQGRDAFQGTEQDLIWLDEECSREIYVECLIRTMTTNGMIIFTFTPLMGLTDIIRDFLRMDHEQEESNG